MKFYDLDTEFSFGKFEGKTLRQIIDLQPSYIDWCAINLEHFYISENVIEEIKSLNPDFALTEEGQEKLNERYTIWENKQVNYHDRSNYEYYERPQSYEEWLNEEFGEDAETAFWNMD